MNTKQKANIERGLNKCVKPIASAFGAWGLLAFAVYLFVEGSPVVGIIGLFAMMMATGCLLNMKIEKVKEGIREQQERS